MLAVINTTDGHIAVTVRDGSGQITSDLKSHDEDAGEFNAAIDGMESLILALAVNGFDVESPKFAQAVQTTLDAIGNQFGN